MKEHACPSCTKLIPFGDAIPASLLRVARPSSCPHCDAQLIFRSYAGANRWWLANFKPKGMLDWLTGDDGRAYYRAMSAMSAVVA